MGIPTNRYSKIMNKHPREICLLRSFPCAWGKCAFCDYIEDNGKDGVLMAQMNRQVLGQVTGEFGVLEVINSGSCFELPKETFEDIDKVIETKDLKQLFLSLTGCTGGRWQICGKEWACRLFLKSGWRPLTIIFARRY